jgi:formylglycine-generating enzyme required for sulfatase activity
MNDNKDAVRLGGLGPQTPGIYRIVAKGKWHLPSAFFDRAIPNRFVFRPAAITLQKAREGKQRRTLGILIEYANGLIESSEFFLRVRGEIMRSLMLCLVVLPFVISWKGSSETNQAGISSESQSTSQVRDLPRITNSIGMKLVLIPKGTFMMGSPESEQGRNENENQHEVTLSKDYYLGVYEVTQAQYEKVMGKNPSHFQGAEVGNENADLPVENVSWDDAVEFCKKLSNLPEEKKAGREYRLPTEAEWEYACRAGSKTAYSFDDEKGLLPEYGWFDRNSSSRTHTVGLLEPSDWGVYDMHGNVWEWCSDWYDEYPKGAVSDPTGPKEGSFRVYRGGGWYLVAADCRSAYRGWYAPSYRNDSGFRVALSPSGIPK